MSVRDWLLPAATGFAGLAAGLLIGGRGGPDPVPERGAVVFPEPATSPTTGPAHESVTLEDVRRVVREELAAHSPRTATPGAGDAPLENSTAGSESEQVAAANQARAILDAAIARRTWTDEDRDALSAQFHAMSPTQRSEWMQQYAQAVNQGLLVPDSDRPPL